MQKNCTFYAIFDKNICVFRFFVVPLQQISIHMRTELRQFKNVPIPSSALQTVLPLHASFTHFVSNLVQKQQLIRLKRGLYIVSPEISNLPLNEMLIANNLYGPSYVSFSTALNHYGLIDDLSQTTTSACIKEEKHYKTPIGRFDYFAIPRRYYPIGIKQIIDNESGYLIATPEKALCDTIIHTSGLNLRSKKDAIIYLEEDLRFDTDALHSLDTGILQACADCGIKSNSIQQIIKLIHP